MSLILFYYYKKIKGASGGDRGSNVGGIKIILSLTLFMIFRPQVL